MVSIAPLQIMYVIISKNYSVCYFVYLKLPLRPLRFIKVVLRPLRFNTTFLALCAPFFCGAKVQIIATICPFFVGAILLKV